MTRYLRTGSNGWPPRAWSVDRSGEWPRVTFLFWTWDAVPDEFWGRLLNVIGTMCARQRGAE